MAGARLAARPRRGAQGAAGSVGDGSGTAGAFRARGEDGCRPQPSEYRHGALGRRDRRRALPYHGGGRRHDARREHPRARPVGREAARAGDPADGRTRFGTCARRHPSRSQARQRHGHRRGPGKGARLRARQADGAQAPRSGPGAHPIGGADPRWPDLRHRGVHVSRAGRGPGGRSAVGHLFFGHRALRDGDRTTGVHRREPGSGDLGDPARYAVRRQRRQPDVACRPFAHHPALPAEGAGEEVRERSRSPRRIAGDSSLAAGGARNGDLPQRLARCRRRGGGGRCNRRLALAPRIPGAVGARDGHTRDRAPRGGGGVREGGRAGARGPCRPAAGHDARGSLDGGDGRDLDRDRSFRRRRLGPALPRRPGRVEGPREDAAREDPRAADR